MIDRPSLLCRRSLPIIILPLLLPRIASSQEADRVPVQLTSSGNVTDGAVSPDGRFVAYVESSPTEDDRLFVRALEGGDATELVRALHVFHLRWSPSSEMLLVGIQPADTAPGEVRILPRDGGPGRTFEAARWFAWSPAEREFAYAFYDPRALFIRDLASEEVETVALSGAHDFLLDLDWSPNGERFAYVVLEQPSRYEVRVIDRSGSDGRTVVVDSVPLYSPRWSRNGRWIFYSRGTDIWRVAPDSVDGDRGAPSEVARLERAVSFDLMDEDGAISYIAVHGSSNLVFLDLTTGDSRLLTVGTAVDSLPAVSPDGREIAFIRRTEGTISLEVLDLASGGTRTIMATEAAACCPAWSPDGREIAYVSTGGPPRLWRIPSSGGTPALVSAGLLRRPTSLQWGANGKFLLQTYDSDQHWIDAATGEALPFELDTGGRILFSARVSPDGSALVGGTGNGLVIASLADGTSREIDTGLPQMPIGWSADGNWIYTQDFGSGILRRVLMSTRGSEVIGDADCWMPAMLPDGASIVCITPAQSDLWLLPGIPD